MLRLLAPLCALAPGALAAQASTTGLPGDTTPAAIIGVTVVHVLDGRLVPAQTVLIRGRWITVVVPSHGAALPEGIRVIDGSGKYLIPGLWDMHTHTPSDSLARAVFFPLAIVNGVTGERHMAGTTEVLRERSEIAAGRLLGPRLIVGSPLIDGPGSIFGPPVLVATPAAARTAADSLRRAGYDFLKVLHLIPRDAYLALTSRARELGIPVAGHLPLEVRAEEAAAAGHRSAEHMIALNLGCAAKEDSLRRAVVAAVRARAADSSFLSRYHSLVEPDLLTLPFRDEQKCHALFQALAKRGTYVVPTLAWHRALALKPDSALSGDPRMQYLPSQVWRLWQNLSGPLPGYRPVFEQHLRDVKLLHDAGVRIMAGTDVLNPYVLPGFSLHDELAMYVEAGLTPAEALQTATSVPALFLGVTDSLGTIAPGKLADLVLLDADPLADIRNTTKIRAIFANGRYLDRASLDSLLARLARTGGARR